MGGTRLRIGKDLYRSRCVRALPCNNSRAESDRAETGGKTDGVIAGDHAAMYAVGLKFFGIIGLFVVPLLVSFLKQLNDRGIIKMFR